MKPKTRNILLIVGFFALIIIGILGYGIYSIYSLFSHFAVAREVPDEIKQARVLKGQELLGRTEFFKLSKDSILKTIGDSTKIEDEKERQKVIQSWASKGIYTFADLKIFGNEIIAVGEFGGFVFDPGGNLKRQILFEPVIEKIKIGPYEQDTYQSNLDNLKIVKLENGKLGFLAFGSTQGARVFDENGNQIWSVGRESVDFGILLKDEKEREADFDKRTYVLEATVGDLNNDGISEYIIARKKDGIRAFDHNGRELWFQPDDFPINKLEVFDLDADGKNELLEIGKYVRDGNGKILREMKGTKGDTFLFVEDKAPKLKVQFLDIRQGRLNYSEENGEKIFETDAPLSEIKKKPEKVEVPGFPEMSYTDDSETVAYPKAVWVGLWKDKPKHLVVVASFIVIPRANLYVYAADGTLIYHELLGEEAETITIAPNNDGTEGFLVGGKDTIWRYLAN